MEIIKLDMKQLENLFFLFVHSYLPEDLFSKPLYFQYYKCARPYVQAMAMCVNIFSCAGKQINPKCFFPIKMSNAF